MKKGNFEFSESADCWISKHSLNDKNVHIEIYTSSYKGNEINWIDVSDFIKEIIDSGKDLENLVNTSKRLLLDFIKHVPFGIQDLKKYRFELVSVYYSGKSEGLIFSYPTHNYSLLLKLFSDQMVESEDPYGNYLVDIENLLIKGVRREQI